MKYKDYTKALEEINAQKSEVFSKYHQLIQRANNEYQNETLSLPELTDILTEYSAQLRDEINRLNSQIDALPEPRLNRRKAERI